MHVDFVWMVDESGRDVLSLAHFKGRAEPLQRPADASLQKVFRDHLSKIEASVGHSSPLDRLLQTPMGLMAFVADPVLRTGAVGPRRGTLVFARVIDDAQLARVRESSQLPAIIYRSAKDVRALPELAQNLWAAPIGQKPRVLRPLDDKVLQAYALLRDVDGAPAAVVETRLERTLLAFGHSTLRYLMILIGAVLALLAVILGGLLLWMENTWRARAASERRYRAVITQAQDVILLADAVGRKILEANPATLHALGFPEAQLLAKTIDELFVVNDNGTVRPVQPEIYAASPSDFPLQVRCHDGRLLDVEVSASPLVIDRREVISFVLRDVSARRKAERALLDNQNRLSHLAHHDTLTGLLNRPGLQARLPEIISNAQRSRRPVAFLHLDIDHFKKVNDLRGHACGDRLLQVAAERLRGSVAATDQVVRMGGDEFAIIATGVRDAGAAGIIAARVREKLAAPFELDGQEIMLTCSVGVSVFPQDGAEYEVLLKNADIALHEAKESGRDTCKMFARSMTTRVNERLTIEHSLRAAIRAEQFYVDYQPIIDLRTNKVESLEALLRWAHPTRGLIPPAVFIDVAEKAGLIAELGEFVLHRVCAQIREWQDADASPVPVAINVSSRQFERNDMASLIAHAAAQAGIDVRMLHVELTESAIMEGNERHLEVLRGLRKLGVPVSIDDFGTGYSSLSYLKNLPIDCLKVDRSFVRDMITSANGEALVTAIIRMAGSLGLRTIAEGVETLDQLKRLREIGATMAQGFYFSPPLSTEACMRLLMESSRREELTETLRLRTLSAVAR